MPFATSRARLATNPIPSPTTTSATSTSAPHPIHQAFAAIHASSITAAKYSGSGATARRQKDPERDETCGDGGVRRDLVAQKQAPEGSRDDGLDEDVHRDQRRRGAHESPVVQ